MSTINNNEKAAPPKNAAQKAAAPNPFINLLVNIVFPAVILNKLSSPDKLGPFLAMLVALSLPVMYGAWEFVTTKHHNFVSILGFVSILLTGGLGLLQVDGVWFAAKEASIPGIIAIITLGSLRTSKPLIKLLLYNERVINVAKVEAALEQNNAQKQFAALMVKTTVILALSFVVSAVLNFFLAIWILKAPAGTPEFNEQLARMTALSYPVIVIPSLIIMMVAVWILIRGLRQLTGLDVEQILHDQMAKN
jgi:hypothetical protein